MKKEKRDYRREKNSADVQQRESKIIKGGKRTT